MICNLKVIFIWRIRTWVSFARHELTVIAPYILGDDLTKAMTELILNLLDENIELREEAARAMELVLKEAGGFPDQIRQLLQVGQDSVAPWAAL